MSKKDINFLNKEQVKMQAALDKQSELIKELCASHDEDDMIARIDCQLPSFIKLGTFAEEQDKQLKRLYKEGKPYSPNLIDCIRERDQRMQVLAQDIYETSDFWGDDDE